MWKISFDPHCLRLTKKLEIWREWIELQSIRISITLNWHHQNSSMNCVWSFQNQDWSFEAHLIMSIWIIAETPVAKLLQLDYVFFLICETFEIYLSISATHLTEVQTKSFKPCNSTFEKINSMLTGLSPPCLMAIRWIFKGSKEANEIFDSPNCAQNVYQYSLNTLNFIHIYL